MDVNNLLDLYTDYLLVTSTCGTATGLFDWAKFRTAKGGIEIHTFWDDALIFPDMINITEAKLHDSKGLSKMVFPKDTIIVEYRTYFDF